MDIELLKQQEILLIDKPKDISSFDVIRILRKKLGIKKMGHAGTLDPNATGLMIIGVNKGTKKLNEFLMIVVRSSIGYNYNVRLVNQIGIIESDYYNNPSNEGHVMIKVQNEGDKVFSIHIGDRIAQGIFVNFNVVDDEEEIKKTRKGGLGSTNKEEKNENI